MGRTIAAAFPVTVKVGCCSLGFISATRADVFGAEGWQVMNSVENKKAAKGQRFPSVNCDLEKILQSLNNPKYKSNY